MNELPQVVVEVSTILSFKKHLDNYLVKRDMGQMRAIVTSLMAKTGQHRPVGPKGLFPL